VWFCSGQSNMVLAMQFTFSRNRTYEAFRRGKYRNIRMFSMAKNAQPDNAWPDYDPFISPPLEPYAFSTPPSRGWHLPSVGAYPCDDGRPLEQCGPMRGSDEWYNNTIEQFSATCWYFAEVLTDLAEARGENVVPFGLIDSAFGGTMVENWQPNATLKATACRNASGAPYSPEHGFLEAGALWNGMVLPFVNMTIKGALWYQGENNIFQCAAGAEGEPDACGHVADGTGYGCFMQSLIESWRSVWSSGPAGNGTTEALFPFGLVSLAGGTSEGFPHSMGAFRLSQAGGTGLLPTERWPNTFVAQAYDLADPGQGAVSAANWHDGQGAYPVARGLAPFTSYFMGPIHPRPKYEVGARLAKAARHFVYGDASAAWTGPVVTSCEVGGNHVSVTFDASLLQGDALAVRRSPLALQLPLDLLTSSPAMLERVIAGSKSLYTSPLEVQYGGTNFTNGIWLSASLRPLCADGGNANVGAVMRGNKPCGVDKTTGAPLPGFNVAIADLPLGSYNASQITAVRYAFRDDPCCPGVNRDAAPCPPASCPIQGYNSSLPAVPFIGKVENGACTWLSVNGGAKGAASAGASFVERTEWI